MFVACIWKRINFFRKQMKWPKCFCVSCKFLGLLRIQADYLLDHRTPTSGWIMNWNDYEDRFTAVNLFSLHAWAVYIHFSTLSYSLLPPHVPHGFAPHRLKTCVLRFYTSVQVGLDLWWISWHCFCLSLWSKSEGLPLFCVCWNETHVLRDDA